MKCVSSSKSLFTVEYNFLTNNASEQQIKIVSRESTVVLDVSINYSSVGTYSVGIHRPAS